MHVLAFALILPPLFQVTDSKAVSDDINEKKKVAEARLAEDGRHVRPRVEESQSHR